MEFKISDRKNHVLANFPNEIFQIDLIDLMKISHVNVNYKYMMNTVNVYLRFAIIRLLLSKKASYVAAALLGVFYEYGHCKYLQSVNGLKLKNKTTANLCKKFNIEQIHGRANYPRSQRIVNRLNLTIILV